MMAVRNDNSLTRGIKPFSWKMSASGKETIDDRFPA